MKRTENTPHMNLQGTDLSKSGFLAKAPKVKRYLRHSSPLALAANV
jgi:hypothetical protein